MAKLILFTQLWLPKGRLPDTFNLFEIRLYKKQFYDLYVTQYSIVPKGLRFPRIGSMINLINLTNYKFQAGRLTTNRGKIALAVSKLRPTVLFQNRKRKFEVGFDL